MEKVLYCNAGRMRRKKLYLLIFCTLSAVMLSLPWLVPHCGAVALVAFLPLLWADWAADEMEVKHFWLYSFYTFILWNALTTFWVCNATVGGGIFAIVANAAQMTLVWILFRLAKKYLGGAVPYIFLAVLWIAWERRYFSVDISWPWITLGNAFAGSTRSVQWYEYTGALGGSLWIWLCNLSIFGLVRSIACGVAARWNNMMRLSSILGITIAVCGPFVLSKCIYSSYEERSEGSMDVIIAQPNLDPYEKFGSLTQAEQTERLLGLFSAAMTASPDSSRRCLLIAPETFTSDIVLQDIESSPTVRRFREFLSGHPGAEMLFGASTMEFFSTAAPPDILARHYGNGWYINRNTAFLLQTGSPAQMYHKSRLVVGVELTPYPRIFVPLDDWLSRKMGVSSLMGRCKGQDEASVLTMQDGTALGCAVCYESIYGEYCTGYVNAGAEAMAVITNDAWWGDTPGYKQHLNYSRLRAIELRRDFARCGNTGISCFIDQKGDIVSQTDWWKAQTLRGSINFNTRETFFVRNGDIVGRVSTLMFFLLSVLLLIRVLMRKKLS